MSMPKFAVIISKVLNMFFASSAAWLWVGVAQPAMSRLVSGANENIACSRDVRFDHTVSHTH